mmetsp:Transcript_15752/g.29010  ORF Transcript_15752/g.29010 Transcript_15752/m.29010 type:complete len:245 (-) Transcript_15752:61-795(-)
MSGLCSVALRCCSSSCKKCSTCPAKATLEFESARDFPMKYALPYTEDLDDIVDFPGMRGYTNMLAREDTSRSSGGLYDHFQAPRGLDEADADDPPLFPQRRTLEPVIQQDSEPEAELKPRRKKSRRSTEEELAELYKNMGLKTCPNCGTGCLQEGTGIHLLCACGKQFCCSCSADCIVIYYHGEEYHYPQCPNWKRCGPPEFKQNCPECRRTGKPCYPPGKPEGSHTAVLRRESGRSDRPPTLG